MPLFNRVGITLNCQETIDGLKSKCPYCDSWNKVLYLQGRWVRAITCDHFLEVEDSAIYFRHETPDTSLNHAAS